MVINLIHLIPFVLVASLLTPLTNQNLLLIHLIIYLFLLITFLILVIWNLIYFQRLYLSFISIITNFIFHFHFLEFPILKYQIITSKSYYQFI